MTFSGQLRFFSQHLRPDSDEVEKAGEATDQISRAIHHLFRSHSVDRITPFGSYPKKTSVRGMMDVDIIVYINNRHPPFGDIIEELYQIVQRNFDPHCTKNFFQVKLRYKGLKVDLLPATNFLPTVESHRGDVDRSIRTQHRRALEYVMYQVEAGNEYLYSTSLSGVSVFFERRRSSFSHSLSRLAKYWCLSLPVTEVLVGRSSIMEYLGAYAAEQVAPDGEDILAGFKYFLNMFDYTDNIHIYWTEFYDEDNIPSDVRRQRPLLLDPCNPYNNFLRIKNNAHLLREMQPYAEATLARLDAAIIHFRQGINVDMETMIFSNYLNDSDTDEEEPNEEAGNSMCILL